MSDINKTPTPAMRQYHEWKARYPDCLLFFRMGDFYEMFYEDAIIASKVLEIALTKRAKEEDAPPMCGVPHHAGQLYINRLIAQGYKVAVCEQMAQPTPGVKVIPREVTQVITPGVVFDQEGLEAKNSNYLMAITLGRERMGVAYSDVTTGEFWATELKGARATPQGAKLPHAIVDEMARVSPKEVIFVKGSLPFEKELRERFTQSFYSPLEEARFNLVACKEALGKVFVSFDATMFTTIPSALDATAMVAAYLADTVISAKGESKLGHVRAPQIYGHSEHMVLDEYALAHLEIAKTLIDRNRRGSLLGTVDLTATSMGGRLLSRWLTSPLMDAAGISRRQDAIEELVLDLNARGALVEMLAGAYDLERLNGKVATGVAGPRDLMALRSTLEKIPAIAKVLATRSAPSLVNLANLLSVKALGLVATELAQAMVDDPPATLKEGGVIRPGYSKELDDLINLSREGKNILAQIQTREQKRTGISSLKITYNRVFGYSIEITRANLEKVPKDYERRQTLANGERYVTPELKEYESKILTADDKKLALEQQLFTDLRTKLALSCTDLGRAAQSLAELDCYTSLAEVAHRNNYVRPVVGKDATLSITEGRHPVVERLVSSGAYVPNDIFMDPATSQLMIITGPNMAGKCLAYTTTTFSSRGVVQIKELKPEKSPEKEFSPIACEVQGKNKQRSRATHFYNGGRQKTIKLTTRLGYELEGTPEHRVWVRGKEGVEDWKKLGELALGDIVAIERHIDLWGTETEMKPGVSATMKGPKKTYPLPTVVDEDFGYFLGLLVGDGGVTTLGATVLTTADDFIANEFTRISKRFFDYEPTYLKSHMAWRIHSTQIRTFLAEQGLGYHRAEAKVVPFSVMRAPKKIVAAFLQGLFDTDGYADKRYGNIQYSTASARLATEVQMLLLNFGIIASRHVKKTKKLPSYQISIYGEDAIKFHREVGFRLPRKVERAALSSGLRMPNIGSIPNLAPTLKEVQARIVQTEDKPVALKHNKSINSIFYTYVPSQRNISYKKLEELIEYCDQSTVPCDELKGLKGNHYLYEPLVLLESGEAEVCDLSVAPDHAYIANGFVSHNSTVMRQVALICLLAQTGSFVPAKEARLPILDRIFTRVGAADNLSRGASTFMVEMWETKNILENATPRSLLLLDEIGRGTSTFDGLSIAWSVAEHIHDRIGALTMFATHYHELTDLAQVKPKTKNYHVAVREWEDQIIFLRKLLPGGANRSYGIHVAQLAGLPGSVIERAKEILKNLEAHELDVDGQPALTRAKKKFKAQEDRRQFTLFTPGTPPPPSPAMEELAKISPDSLTPMQALTALAKLKAMLEEEG
jgi:DNA mismatch repair protein MutS